MKMGVLTKSDIVKVKEIDRNVKNKFSFAWLERTVEIACGLKVSLGDFNAKTDDAGQTVCKLGNKHINYTPVFKSLVRTHHFEGSVPFFFNFDSKAGYFTNPDSFDVIKALDHYSKSVF